MKRFTLIGLFLLGSVFGAASATNAAGGCGQGAVTFTNPSGRVVVCPVHPNVNNCGVNNVTGQFVSRGNGRVHICPIVPAGG